MQTIYLDFAAPCVRPILHAKQGDVQSRFFCACLLDGGTAYSIPAGASLSVRFRGPGSQGWYDTITEPAGGTHSAFAVSGNKVTVEIASAVLTASGTVTACLMVNTAAGVQLGAWDITIEVEALPVGDDAIEATEYYTVLTQQVAATLTNASAAAASATAAQAAATQCQEISQLAKGYYANVAAIRAAWPVGQVGWWAINGATDSVWVWDDATSNWVDTHKATDLSNYYTKTQADAITGVLSDLTTTAKGNLVAAINEVNDKDVDVTSTAITTALGYTPANETYIGPMTLLAESNLVTAINAESTRAQEAESALNQNLEGQKISKSQTVNITTAWTNVCTITATRSGLALITAKIGQLTANTVIKISVSGANAQNTNMYIAGYSDYACVTLAAAIASGGTIIVSVASPTAQPGKTLTVTGAIIG